MLNSGFLYYIDGFHVRRRLMDDFVSFSLILRRDVSLDSILCFKETEMKTSLSIIDYAYIRSGGAD